MHSLLHHYSYDWCLLKTEWKNMTVSYDQSIQESSAGVQVYILACYNLIIESSQFFTVDRVASA